MDPRTTDTAAKADLHLPIRYGTDAALLLAWINVTIEEGLYDHEFVKDRCTGFDALRQRVASYTPEAVAEICGISADLIRQSARTYAQAEAAIMPWGVVGDMQVNSTSMLQAQCILRAICGFLGRSERVFGPCEGIVSCSELADFPRMPPAQWEKQLGRETHPLLTSRAAALYREAEAAAGLTCPQDIMAQSLAADPASLFAAMRGEGPYPVRALISAANNTIMSFAGQPGIVEAFLAQDLVVAFENWMTPTAQLADYVLPGDMWAERDTLGKPFDVAPMAVANQAFCEPAGQCRSWYAVVKGLADRLGLDGLFPWKDARELFDWRLQPAGLSFQELCGKPTLPLTPAAPGQFLTPSGKVELESSVLKALGFDGLPHYEEPADPGAQDGQFPYVMFAGTRESANYNTALRQMPNLRAQEPEPRFFINPADADREGVQEGRWHWVESAYGRALLQAHRDERQPEGTLRIPHGWWKPETKPGLSNDLAGAQLYNDGLLFPDEPWNLDGPQGAPGLRGSIHGRISAPVEAV